MDHPVIVLDQRNHGRSSHAPSHTYDDMVGDLLQFADRLELERFIPCGHSMGGKVAMLFSLLHPERVHKLAVMDIAPIRYSHSHAPFLEALLEIDLTHLKSRSEADRALQQAIPDTGTRLFLLQSLTGSPGAYQWRLNLPILHQFMAQIVDFPASMVNDRQSGADTVLICGEMSTYVRPEHYAEIRKYFTEARIVPIAEAGHWLHVEQPQRVLEALQEFIKN